MLLGRTWPDYREVPDGSPIVCLYGADRPGLVVSAPTGVIYYNQAGGYACLQPAAEGFYVPIWDDDQLVGSRLSSYFSAPQGWSGWCANGIEPSHAAELDAILDGSRLYGVSVDRGKLNLCVEAWIFVDLVPRTTTRCERLQREDAGFNRQQLEGGGPYKAILTWNNSD